MIKWVNEIMHRIIQKISLLRRGKNGWTDNESWRDLKHWVSQNKELQSEVGEALRQSFLSLEKR